MKDLDIIKSIAELMDSLGYDRSKIFKTKNKGSFSLASFELYSINLRILGAHKLYGDLTKSIGEYGKLAGLWTKQKQLEDLIILNDGRKARGTKLNKELAKKSITLLKKKKGKMTYKELKNHLNLSHHRTGSIIRRLDNEGIIQKLSRGHYGLVD